MATAKIFVKHEVKMHNKPEWCLCFQWGEYQYEDDSSNYGYRFIWRRPNGDLAPQRGQARIPNLADMFALLNKAAQAGWLGKCESE